MKKPKPKPKTSAKPAPAKRTRSFAESIELVAEDLELEPSEVTKAQYFAHEDALPEWDVRKLGGFTALKRLTHPEPTEGLNVRAGAKLAANHRAKLDREYGQALFVQQAILDKLPEVLAANPVRVHPPQPKARKAPTPNLRTLVADLSDTHFGSNIELLETHGINEFNWQIAANRLAQFCEQIATFKPEHRAHTDLVLQLNGDILAGMIHNQEWFVDLLTTQFSGSLSILSQAISYLATKFKAVRVVCTPGNHGRAMHKESKSRATTHKWDSYENMLYLSLRMVLAKHPNVSFLIPEAPFALYQVQGHWVFQTHGDTVLNVGMPGRSINMADINAQVNKISASSLVGPADRISVVSVGHVHVPTVQLLESGATVVINGCLSGADPFANAIGVFTSNPTQMLFESTPDHAVGDIRMIRLNDAPNQEIIVAPTTKM